MIPNACSPGEGKHGHEFFGATTMGERGQIVVPAEAREALNLQKGEKLLVFGLGGDMIALTKIDALEKISTHIKERLELAKKTLEQNEL